jgi:hypothetical protein
MWRHIDGWSANKCDKGWNCEQTHSIHVNSI